MRGHARRLWPKNLLETLANSVADRSAGLVIELFDVVCVWVFHDQFRALTLLGQVTAYQVARLKFVSAKLRIPIGFG